MAPKLKLVYFNIRGRGELIRLTLTAGGVEFTDHRIEYADWPAQKADAPNGVLPYIEASGQKYGEAMALVRFVARKCNLNGKDEAEQLMVDMVLCQVNALRDEMARYRMDPLLRKEQQKFLKDKVIKEKIPKFLEKIENNLTSSKNGFLMNSGLTVADLAVFDTIEAALDDAPPNLLSGFPKLTDHQNKVRSLPKLAKYLAARPVTKM